MPSLLPSKALAAIVFTIGALVLIRVFLAALRGSGFARLFVRPVLVRRKRFMTPVEAQTLRFIETLFPHLRVHAQVAMSALIAPARGLSPKDRLWTHRRYGQKVVDFVLEDRRSGRIELLVELDDWTHDVGKDRLRDRITASGGYPTVRLPA
ncbi:MAG: DUF2726 domain-containing protein, partial [Xanthobacteraceae bacterium]|nr:DUF2726 domain-containing protein [Xanthobacteraceae bacterium]